VVAGVVVVAGLAAGTAGLLRPGRSEGPSAGPATTLTAVGGSGAEGQAKVTGDGRRMVVTLETLRLPAPGPGRFYQVWLARRGQRPTLALGALATDNQGIWSVPGALVERYDGQSMEVWLEPADEDPAPSGRPVLRGPFRA
jgi:Anti-sigma-K factor rskA